MKTSAFPPAALAVATAIATIATLTVPPSAHAQSQTATTGNANGGANANVNSLVATCASCHGAKGEGNPASNFPRIAGQSKAYLARQLKNYADGSRKNQVMEPIAKGLTPQQIDAVAGYFSALSPPEAKSAQGNKNAQALKRGETLATVGDDKLGVQGCANCHGPGGSGEPPTYPYLGGQHAGYLSAALTEWKNGTRKTDPSMQMNLIAKRLSDADINALSAYYAAQMPPVPASQRTNTAAGTPQRPAAPSGTAQGSSSGSQAVGAEQGAPTSGGSQGIGGGGASSGSGSTGGSQSGPGSNRK
jgi:cytochrome c553